MELNVENSEVQVGDDVVCIIREFNNCQTITSGYEKIIKGTLEYIHDSQTWGIIDGESYNFDMKGKSVTLLKVKE